MNKLLLVAAIGSVEACPIRDFLNSLKPHCPESNVPKLDSIQLNRLFLKNSYQGFVTGLYQENDKVVTDKCFGAWVEAPLYKAKDLHHKFHEDFWSVGIDEVKDVGAELIDVFYKNTEVCHFERVGDDVKSWCIENPGQCIFMENMESRIFDNIFEIMGKLFDIGKLINTDDTCYTEYEQMAELYRFVNDLGEITASLSGFDLKWDQSITRKHIKRKAFHSQIKELYENYQYKNVNPLELMFPDVYEILKELEKEIEKFFKDMDAWGKRLSKSLIPRHHHAKLPHKQHHHPFQMPELKAPEFKAPEMKMPEFKFPEFDLFPHPHHKQPQHHHHHQADWSHFKLF